MRWPCGNCYPCTYEELRGVAHRQRGAAGEASRGRLAQRIDRIVQSGQRQWIHPLLQNLADDLDGGRMAPAGLRARIDPGELGVRPRQPLEPDLARLGIPVLDAAARVHDLVWAHGRVADEDELVVRGV